MSNGGSSCLPQCSHWVQGNVVIELAVSIIRDYFYGGLPT